ncbi:BTB/POZ domain-containing protein 7-like [Mytilus trossulus]|uniref:BTB/POZ domain-containing protein 7-like n=1 Tax=Mytilus trossulus TaxID=6551 RepID=UPI0030061772
MGANSSYMDSSGASGKSQQFPRLGHQYTVSETDISVKEKRKKASKFATLRKKLIRSRRHSRSLDYGRALRDMISSWSFRDVNCLIQEYEALAALKELALAANVARPPANSFRQDLSHLFDSKLCTDVDLVYRGACFPAHRAMLSARSPYFRNLLRYHPFGSQVPVKLKTVGVDVSLFAILLRYLYTDSINLEELRKDHREILRRLAEEFGLPNQLEFDLRTLLESGDYCDALLVFSCDSECSDSLSHDLPPEGVCKAKSLELPCHKCVLAARSQFFRNLLLRRARSGEELTERTLQTTSLIVLDESVIPRKYARVLLNAIYQDSVDLSLILRGSASMCSLSEAQAIVAGKGQMTLVDEAMEVYQIGQFLDFPILSQGCEDIITEHISVDNILSILNWSSEPHGSEWVHRQAIQFMREEFLQIIQSPIFYELTKEQLIDVVCSDFLQAGELDILSAVLKWGEHHLVKKIEEREPNILSHTAHSISKKGVKKRDLNDNELRDILCDIISLVRIDHVIPYNNEILNSAIKRGLISSPPLHMMGDETCQSLPVSTWIRTKCHGTFTRPRLFTPYFEESKAVLEEQMSQDQDQDSGRVRTIQMSSIPDTLYMVEDRQSYIPFSSGSSTVDIVAGTIPVPDQTTMKMMIKREKEFQESKLTIRALSLPYCDRRVVNYQIQLRIVREFGLPDSTIEILQNSHFYHSNNVRHHHHPQPPTPVRTNPLLPIKRRQSPPLSRRSRHGSPTKPIQMVSPTRSLKQPDINPCHESVLSETMPDIAMATASVSQVHLQDEFELDIGDGTSHPGTMYI